MQVRPGPLHLSSLCRGGPSCVARPPCSRPVPRQHLRQRAPRAPARQSQGPRRLRQAPPRNHWPRRQRLEPRSYRPGTHHRSKYEHVSVCYQSAGGHFTGEVREWDVAPRLVKYLVENFSGWDLWFGVNALNDVREGRGTEADVIRLTSLYADVDIKPGGARTARPRTTSSTRCRRSWASAPTAINYRGHGLHPYWPIDVESASTQCRRCFLRPEHDSAPPASSRYGGDGSFQKHQPGRPCHGDAYLVRSAGGDPDDDRTARAMGCAERRRP